VFVINGFNCNKRNCLGLHAFEGVEDDRSKSDPGVKHISVEGNNYRFEMHTKDRDGSDRQRNEVKGMVSNGKQLHMLEGETWKFTYSMFIPSSLKGTTSFTHIAQMKMPGDGSTPIYVMSLRRNGDKEHIEAKIFQSNTLIGETDLTPIHDKWVEVELEFHVHESTGSANWTLISNGKTLVHGEKTHVKTFIGDSVRPKWGIYRSISDTKQLHDTHLLITKLRAYKLE
jgi:hypothetical protein